MGIISEIIGYPLGWVMWALYQLFGNYAIAIVFFTFLTKILTFFVSAKSHKSSIYMSTIQSKVDKLKVKYGNNKEKFQEEQMKLYQEEGVNPMGSCLPLLIQFPILYGIFDVVYRPMTHILRVNKETIETITALLKPLFESENNYDARPEIYIVQALKTGTGAEIDAVKEQFPAVVESVQNFNNLLFGGDMGTTPTFTPEVWNTTAIIFVMIPFLSGIFQILISIYSQNVQKKRNTNSAAAENPMMKNMMFMMVGMAGFSVWIGFGFPVAVGFYWTISAIFSFLQQLLMNKIYTPEKVIALMEKEKAKKKNKKKSGMMEKYQKLLEEQRAAQGLTTTATEKKKNNDDDDSEEGKFSKSQQKDYERLLINEARRKQAEKYGEEFNEE